MITAAMSAAGKAWVEQAASLLHSAACRMLSCAIGDASPDAGLSRGSSAECGLLARDEAAAGCRDQQAGSLLHPSLAAITGLVFATAGFAADWPMHRGGPEMRGIANEPAPGKVELAWTFKAGKPVKAAAAIASGRVVFGDDAGIIHAVELATGKEVWSFKTEGAIEATPLILDGTVYLGSSDAFLYALDAEKGALKWKYETGDKIMGGANFVKNAAGARVLVGSYDANLHCVDAATGKEVWKHETGNYINGAPVISTDGLLMFGGCDSFIHVLDIATGKELRQIESEAYIAGSAGSADGLGYVGNYGNLVLAFDPKAGSILWKYRDRNFPYFSSPAITADRVIIGGRDKRLHCIDRAKGEKVWIFQTRGDVDSSPVVCGDAVIVGSADGRLYCVALADGKERWAYQIGAPITASPAVADGRIVIGAEDGNLYCFTAAK